MTTHNLLTNSNGDLDFTVDRGVFVHVSLQYRSSCHEIVKFSFSFSCQDFSANFPKQNSVICVKPGKVMGKYLQPLVGLTLIYNHRPS